MDLPATATPESLGKIDFDIHGMVRIRLIDPSPRDLSAAHKLLGCPSRLPLTNPEITVRFVEDLSASGIRFLGDDRGFTDDGFFLLQEGTRRVKARIPFDRIGDSCEIVCRSQSSQKRVHPATCCCCCIRQRRPIDGRLGALWENDRAFGVRFRRGGVCRGRVGAFL